MKLAIIDGDGVLWDNDARMEIAAKAAQIASDIIKRFEKRFAFTLEEKEYKQIVEGARWKVAFDPELIALDKHIPHTVGILAMLAASSWEYVILSSNIETTRTAREQWLNENDLADIPLYLKDTGTDADPRDRYIKTPAWKAKAVQRIIDEHGGEAAINFLLFVDDEEKNRNTVMEAFSNAAFWLMVTNSLEMAIQVAEPKLAAMTEWQQRMNGENAHIEYPINPEG